MTNWAKVRGRRGGEARGEHGRGRRGEGGKGNKFEGMGRREKGEEGVWEPGE